MKRGDERASATPLAFGGAATHGLAVAAALGLGLLGSSAALTQAPNAAPAVPALPSVEVDSYDLGLMFGNQLMNSGLGKLASRKELMRGIDAALAGKIPTAEQREAVQQFSRANREAPVTSNAKLAKEFLASNTHAAGNTTLPSGLQYRVLDAGAAKAAPPAPTDQVTLRYRLNLADGTVLDRSEDHPQQAVFRVNSVIPAWREALLAMRPVRSGGCSCRPSSAMAPMRRGPFRPERC